MIRFKVRAFALACIVSPAVLLADPPAPGFTLGAYVPESCTFYLHVKHNPEHEFIDRKWDRIFTAVKHAGLLEAFKNDLAASMDQDARAHFEDVWARSMDFVRQVSWGDLWHRELVLAMRFSPVPGVVLLCQGRPGTGPSNATSLLSLLDQCAAYDDNLEVCRRKRPGVRSATLDLPGTPLSLQVLHRKDTIVLCTDRSLASEVIGLMQGRSNLRALVDSPKFKRALTSLPVPEDTIIYADWQASVAGLQELLGSALERVSHGPGQDHALEILHKIMRRVDVLDYTLKVARTQGRKQFTDSVTTLQPGRQQAKLARAFTEQEPLKNPLRLIPANATAFSATSGVNLAMLYSLVGDILRQDLPYGQELLDQWDAWQAEVNFDLQQDLLSWLDGRVIVIGLRPDRPRPFGGSNEVILLGVKDERLARQKVQAGLARLQGLVMQYLKQPLTVTPAQRVNAEGFQTVSIPMLAIIGQPVVGVAGGWLVVGSCESAINQVIETAAGRAPSIEEQPRFRREGLTVEGPIRSVGFSDLRTLGRDLATSMMMPSIMLGFMPREEEVRPVRAMMAAMTRIGPILGMIDFYSSSATTTTFDGNTWHSKKVVTYRLDD